MKTKKSSSIHVCIKEFATTIFGLLKSDRDVTIGVAGFTGEGKTRFTDALLSEYSLISKTAWDFNYMTWSRKELLEWVDGKKGADINPATGLREGQLPEYSALCPDELFYMFYKRTWFEQEQIDAVSTFNTCRDRHLLVIGNVPDLWDLDGSFLKRLRFYVYISERGKAWVFQQENNPFAKDPWNVSENKLIFRKHRNPYSISNFICEMRFTDWSTERKKEYYTMRNIKRVKALQDTKNKRERYGDIKDQRDSYIIALYDFSRRIAKLIKEKKIKLLEKEYHNPLSHNAIADIGALSHDVIRFIVKGKE